MRQTLPFVIKATCPWELALFPPPAFCVVHILSLLIKSFACLRVLRKRYSFLRYCCPRIWKGPCTSTSRDAPGYRERLKGFATRSPAPRQAGEGSPCALGAPWRGGRSPDRRTCPGGAPRVPKGSRSRGWRRGEASRVESWRNRASEPKGWKARGWRVLWGYWPGPKRGSLTSVGLLSCEGPGEGARHAGPTLLRPPGPQVEFPEAPRRLRNVGSVSAWRAWHINSRVFSGTDCWALPCALRPPRGPAGTQTAPTYPPRARRPRGLRFSSLITFRFPGTLERLRAYPSCPINVYWIKKKKKS